MGYATPEVPRALRLRSDCDLVALGRCHGACTPGGTPGPGYASTHAVALPRSLFWQPPPGCGPGRPLGHVENAVSGILRLQVRDLSTRGQYATPEAASPARVGQVPTPPGLQLTASAAEPFEHQTRRREPRKKVTFCLWPCGSSQMWQLPKVRKQKVTFFGPLRLRKTDPASHGPFSVRHRQIWTLGPPS